MRVATSLRWILPIAALLACSDSTGPVRLDVPSFVFVSDSEGVPALFRFDADVITRLSAPGNDDREPHSAAGRIVFTSRRDGNPEIYAADLSLTGQVRLTTTAATDDAPALDPSGTTIAFVSTRSGTPRIWLMDVTGANPRALATGSATLVPEGSPAWSPDGSRIAFTSTRTNTSQVHVMPVAGGAAVQLSHEATGAFTPEWSADGQSVLYMVASGDPRLKRVSASGGDALPFAGNEASLSEVACHGSVCLAVEGALNGPGDVIVMSGNGRARRSVLTRVFDDRQPAFLIP